MVPPETALTGKPDSFRFEGDRLLFAWVFMAVMAVIAHAMKIPIVALALYPLVMVFQQPNTYRLLVLVFATNLVLFEMYNVTSQVKTVFMGDSLIAGFLLLLLLSIAGFNRGTVVIPYSGPLLALYAFVAYGTAMSARSLASDVPRLYILYDVRCLLYFLLAPLLLLLDRDEGVRIKKWLLLLMAIVVFSGLHSIWLLGEFLVTGERAQSWNEIFVSDAIIIALVLLGTRQSTFIKRILIICLALCFLGLLATQSRGVWISTAVALVAYAAQMLLRRKGRALIKRNLVPIVVLAVMIFAGFQIMTGMEIQDFVKTRMSMMEPAELVNPYTSIGYRIHESWAVWDQRTWLGHGPGATIYLFFTQLRYNKFMEWWAIHSGYFEILHKYGFVGLGLLFLMFGSLFVQGWRMAKARATPVRAVGSIIMLLLINHAVVSITSGYFLRPHVVVLWALFFYFAHKATAVTGDGRVADAS